METKTGHNFSFFEKSEEISAADLCLFCLNTPMYQFTMDPFKSPQESQNYESQKILYAEEVMQNPNKAIKGATKIVTRKGKRLSRSYQCEECNYKTTENSNMRKHIRRADFQIGTLGCMKDFLYRVIYQGIHYFLLTITWESRLSEETSVLASTKYSL